MKETTGINLTQFKNLLKIDNIFQKSDCKNLLDEINYNNICINKLYKQFIKFKKSLKIMSSIEYGKKYSRLEFVEDIKEFTLYDYNGCFIEYNKNTIKFYVPLYNSGFDIYECIGVDSIHLKKKGIK